MKKWYQLSAKELLEQLATDKDKGLTPEEAASRLKQHGPNELGADKKLNPLKLFIGQFKDVLIIVLLIAAFVSLGLSLISEPKTLTGHEKLEYYSQEFTQNRDPGDPVCRAESPECGHFTLENIQELPDPVVNERESPKEALLIFAIVIAIALVGFFNEYKAEKTVAALKMLVAFKARVKRSGKVIEVDASELVPGDIVLLEAGQKVPADIRLIEVSELQCNESSLTGESLPVNKNTDIIKEDVPLGDQKCMVFAGTFLTNGSAVGLVVGTGQNTEIGKIAGLVSGVESEDTPMQRKLDNLGKKLGYIIAALCVLVFFIVFFFVRESADQDLIRRLVFAFTAAVALAVAAIPEGLAFVVRISLALGARRMAGKNALVRKLSAVEALGSTDTICSDKTGTLTKGEMTVRSLYIAGEVGTVTGSGYEMTGKFSFKSKPKKLQHLLEIGALCNNSTVRDDKVIGDPTEGALIVSAGKAKIDAEKLLGSYPKIKEYPFSSERKRMSTVHKTSNGEYLVAAKGAVEVILAHCKQYYDKDGEAKPLTEEIKHNILKTNEQFATQALRVLAFASKQTGTQPKDDEDAEDDLIFIGLQAMMDPPRTEVIEVIHRVQAEAGMRVIMITGDYIETARAVAKEIGIEGEAISGPELQDLSQEEFEKRVETIGVYARVDPEHKIRIVRALKKHGHQVAMTGDGVNDAPAIKAADIGIAMGITGTDVSKEAADLILLDDQFLTIVNAIEEGRGIFDNVRKFVNFLISCNIAEVIAVIAGILFFNDLILTAAQLLFINIVTDGLPAVALGSDPAQRNILGSKPKRFQEAIITKRVWAEIVVFGVLMSALLIGQFWYNLTYQSHVAAVSAAFTAMVVYEMVRLVDIRTDYKIRWFSNPWLSIAIASSLALQLMVLYLPGLAKYFAVGPLSAHDWSIMLFGSVVLIIVMKLLNPLLDKLISKEHYQTAGFK